MYSGFLEDGIEDVWVTALITCLVCFASLPPFAHVVCPYLQLQEDDEVPDGGVFIEEGKLKMHVSNMSFLLCV